VDQVVRHAVNAIELRDWQQLKALLHPYLHWTRADGRTLRGRNNVLAYLAAAPAGRPPTRSEIRDGQIYRWVE
jgi:SnoaL-like domain